ncbi:MAG TPA: DUF2600 family protein [Solirubrobacteraceae bacterium]|jgi:hypothetical protein|nr:DUF2600 family protein [Solirubrobacteraceae bacterium]
MAVALFRDRGLLTRSSFALLLANGRYWTGVAPIVRTELKRWQMCAAEIEDSELRAVALSKLHDEGFHADAAAMFATRAPRAHRRSVVEAIVALELLFDYLDGLTERPSSDPVGDSERHFATLIDAVGVASTPGTNAPRAEDSGYPQLLSRAVALAISRLPAASAIAAIAGRTAHRAAEAQSRIHALHQTGAEQLEAWVKSEPPASDLGWRELVASAGSSVLVLHALIAAAANPNTTCEQATAIESAYLSTCVLLTLLDGLVDYEQDASSGGSQGTGYISLYEDPDQLPELLGRSARRAVLQARALPSGPHHVMLLTGVVAYYSTAPGARTDIAKPAVARLQRELAPLILPTVAVMRTWRYIKRRPASPGFSNEAQDEPRSRRRGVPMQAFTGAPEVELLMKGKSTPRRRLAVGWLTLAAIAIGAIAIGASAFGAGTVAWGGPLAAHTARTLTVHDEGHLRYVKSSGSVIIDEGRASGTFPGTVKVRFSYDGEPTVSARFTISGAGGSISASGTARLSSLTSPTPSFTGTMTITGGSGRYAHVHGGGGLYGVYSRRTYGLTVQAIGKLPY